MEDIQKQGVDPIEKQQEDEALKDVKDEEIRTRIIEKYGLNEDDNSELIDKLVVENKEHSKKLSTAIRQKIDWRTEAQAPKEEKKEVKPQEPLPKTSEDLDKIIGEKFEERDLASMDLSDELKSEVRAYAKAKGISYRQAVKSDYFNFFKGKEDERIKAEEASASSKGTTIKARRDFGNLSDSDIANLSDEEFAEYKKWLKSQG